MSEEPVRKRKAVKKVARKIHHRPWHYMEEDELLSVAFSIVTVVSFGVKLFKLIRGRSVNNKPRWQTGQPKSRPNRQHETTKAKTVDAEHPLHQGANRKR